MIRQAFTRNGNAPDLGALAASIRTAVGDPFYVGVQFSIGGVVTVVVEKPTAWQASEIAAVQAAVTAAADATPQTDAQNQVDQLQIKDKAVLSLLIKELNILRAAVVPTLQPRTLAQAIAAVRNETGNV
jgi:hypothetical protein